MAACTTSRARDARQIRPVTARRSLGRGSVRDVTDPFLLSDDDAGFAGDRPAGARARRSAREGASLAARVRATLDAAGLREHRLHGAGGYYLNDYHHQDGSVLVSWVATEQSPEEAYRLDSPAYQPDTFELRVERIMHPALLAIMLADGLTARQIPDDEDFAGYITATDPAAPVPPATAGTPATPPIP
jgi:hypothetical protein